MPKESPQYGYISALQCQIGTEMPKLALVHEIADFVFAYILTSDVRKMAATSFRDPKCTRESDAEVPRTSK